MTATGKVLRRELRALGTAHSAVIPRCAIAHLRMRAKPADPESRSYRARDSGFALARAPE